MPYETLLVEAETELIEVYEKNLKSAIKGLYSDRIIWINKNQSTIEKGCVLAEELGHYHTSTGNILNQKLLFNRKQEKKARNWAFKKLVPLTKIIHAHKLCIRNRYELAEYLEVTEDFLEDAIQSYKEEYGLSIKIDDRIICFEPLGVIELFE